MKLTHTFDVEESQTASKVGSGLLPVFSTPSMIAQMEYTAMQLVPLKEGESSVGTSIHAEHLKASVIGTKLICTAEVIEYNEKKYRFYIEVKDEEGNLVGKANHTRYIIDIDKFMSGLK